MNFQSFFSKSIFFNNFIYFESEMWCDLILGAWVLCPVKWCTKNISIQPSSDFHSSKVKLTRSDEDVMGGGGKACALK